jgi:hypothetical protein
LFADIINKGWRKPNGKSRMDNLETQSTFGTFEMDIL